MYKGGAEMSVEEITQDSKTNHDLWPDLGKQVELKFFSTPLYIRLNVTGKNICVINNFTDIYSQNGE